ncbi:EAL domain-containing protein (putative c-di-GMP-specific phosphodiesterase class I) [Paraburkholderia bannensis]|uniref:EAL domain-containing protein (Putative c-di-GMP-specific phosphodiesterase class I) n=1 Tax=Paraburkholderia bannensis TaxID=765414 RepID=A0A7W9U571_9BURK|nr:MULTISPECIES: EAL domain-containing protein [Paraburkholderia]MBB3261138.1 EAL domain-containing protein (putative c-di-GMP-specific phosphodiesterase class I) [Paraburkholderia sp. WP4_3_2]MBB6106175.1 EAL domain-containing protein (putative c-di-GMP-specific phosphodiesterase class I) [Paraburkholderia bannensis]
MASFKVHRHDEATGQSNGCSGCKDGARLPVEIDFAFQPIVDVTARTVFACEALVRGPNGESALSVLSQIDDASKYRFDQYCRQVAIASAAALGLDAFLSINFMPNAVYRPEVCIRSTLEAAHANGFPIERIIFETVEGEHLADRTHLVQIFKAYKEYGFLTAIDDFGAGYSGLALLVDFQPDIIKLDMALLRGIDTDTVRQHIVRGVISMCHDLGIRVVAEGIETKGERDFFIAHGVSLMQGYFFAKPAFKSIPTINKTSYFA